MNPHTLQIVFAPHTTVGRRSQYQSGCSRIVSREARCLLFVGDAERRDQHVPHACCHRPPGMLDLPVEQNSDACSGLKA